MSDPLSPVARQLVESSRYDRLVGPSRAPDESRRLLDTVTPDQLLTAPAAHPAAAHALLAGLWLLHDGLDECHEIVQRSPDDPSFAARGSRTAPAGNAPSLRELTATFAYWHAVMHRREGDFWNAKYWYAKCAGHPAHARLAASAAPALAEAAADRATAGPVGRLARGGWDPAAWVDLAEATHRQGDGAATHGLAVALQRLEWRALFDETVRQAVGR